MPRRTKSGSAGSDRGLLIPPAGSVIVRMYATGFGDCFLLAFRGDDDEPRYMLIDCGVHMNYTGGKERLQVVARDIAKTCGNKIHIIAVTHEHTDHIYGFMYAEETFRNLEIGELWLAWTENPEDTIARDLAQQYGKQKAALLAAINRLGEVGHPHVEILRNIFGFESGIAGSGATPRANDEIMNALRSWSKKNPERPEDYLMPGNEPREIPGVSGIRCYVLGPPRDPKAIRKMEAKGEMYLSGLPMNAEHAFIAAVTGMSGSAVPGGTQELRGYPFNAAFSVLPEEAESAFDGFFREYYGFSDGDGHGAAWRRIDTDWLESPTDDLALSIGEYTNNTSLVLAFELTTGSGGRVLLFPGDAQAGNWLSWIPDPNEKDSEKRKNHVDGERLLRETVFYKVGHHGSWNATMKQKGLELMDKSRLVAMIPVDEAWALSRKPKPWHHPDPKILPELMQHARGRVLRSDRIPEGDSMEMPAESREAEWKEFLKNVKWDKSPEKLWIQYTIQ